VYTRDIRILCLSIVWKPERHFGEEGVSILITVMGVCWHPLLTGALDASRIINRRNNFFGSTEADHILDGLMLVMHHQKGAVVYLHYSLGWIIPINFQSTSSHLFIVLIYSSSCLH